MLGKDELARLTWDNVKGAVVLTTNWRFRAVPDQDADENDHSALDMLAASADVHTGAYRYSPGHGQPGAVLAHDVAARLGARVELPLPAPAEPGVVY